MRKQIQHFAFVGVMLGKLWLTLSLNAVEAPRLVIDPQGHTGMISQLIFTPDGSELISLSHDRTVRIWDVVNGELRKTLRVQIGDGKEGMLYAGAISPDGKILALGGLMKFDGTDGPAIRLVDLASGKEVGILRGHSNVVNGLAFSPDGNELASASSDNTVRIWNVTPFHEATEVGGEMIRLNESVELKGHSQKVQALAYSPGGLQLVSASYDKTLILWGRDDTASAFASVATMSGHKGEVYTVDFSPDGESIVSGGFDDRLLLWSAKGGSLKKELDSNMGSDVGTVAFSPDGLHILASSESASSADYSGIYEVSSGKQIARVKNHDNSVLAGAWHPHWNMVATAGGNRKNIVIWQPLAEGGQDPGAIYHDLVGSGQSVYVVAFDKSGSARVAFGSAGATRDASFGADLERVFNFESFELEPTGAEESYQRVIENHGGQFFRREDPYTVKIENYGRFKHDPSEKDEIKSFTFSRDGQSIIVGSEFGLARYEKAEGAFELACRFVGHGGAVTFSSPSLDGRHLASSSTDGTVRLWNLQTGDLLASLFVGNDSEWVCWTPQGYFAASPDGGKYIGWHLNQGFEKMAKFVSGEQLFDQFYRPDIVKTAIESNRPPAEILQELKVAVEVESVVEGVPEIVITEPGGNVLATERRFDVKVEAVDTGKGIGEVRVFHEGKRLQPDGPGSMAEKRYSVPFTASLVSGKNHIRAVAVSPEGVESSPEVVTIDFEGNKASARLHLLAVGLNEYKNPKFNLNYCRPDVDAFADSFLKRSGTLFTDVQVHKLYDADATGEAISAKMKEIAEVAAADDVFVFAFAGHGVMSEGGGDQDPEFHMIPYDVTQMYGNDAMLAELALSGSHLQQLAAAIPARKQLMVLDACQSGGVVESFAIRGAAEERALAQLARSSGMYVLASTRSEQFATEAEELGHGLFTFALLEAIEGKGDANSDGKITVKEVEAWLNERVPELSEKHTGAAQYPNSFARGQDFPIGVIQ